ncbi:MAG: low specificity L-threonine aldolase [Christensenellaceae bacterium]|nr:low specificity L-threonine aldolase [Christensenellaceae bacterium]
MLHFECDYMEGAHPNILARLTEINFEKNTGYGKDAICERAKDRIRAACACPGADVHFLVGGTQINSATLTALLRPWQGVIAAQSGHIATHEAGAVEMLGHKVLTLPGHDGKLLASEVEAFVQGFFADENHPHAMEPGVVYISHPTEYGTLYTAEELAALSAVCHAYGMKLYVDGARLGYGLAAQGTDVSLPLLARLCDAFYIGGTKVGAMFGEALVVPDPATLPHFFTVTKQHGALLAKGWLLGVQFDVLFENDLYFALGRHADGLADRMREMFIEKGYTLHTPNPTNQVFVVLKDEKMKELATKVGFDFWEKPDNDHTVVRFATSWATRAEDVQTLYALL